MHKSTFQYLKPTEGQVATMAKAREAFEAIGNELTALVPDGPDKTHAMRTLREAAMWVNVAITRQPDGSPR